VQKWIKNRETEPYTGPDLAFRDTLFWGVLYLHPEIDKSSKTLLGAAAPAAWASPG